jgi:hypothetical protein
MQFADDINVAEKSLNTHASRAMGVPILHEQLSTLPVES